MALPRAMATLQSCVNLKRNEISAPGFGHKKKAPAGVNQRGLKK